MKDSDINEGKILLDTWDKIEKAWAFEIALMKKEANVINNNTIPAFEGREGVGFTCIRLNSR